MPPMKYELLKNMSKQIPKGTWSGFFSKTGKAYELWPLWGAFGFWGGIFGLIIYHSFAKTEIWLNRTNSTPPWEWARSRHEFEKRKRILMDAEWHRIPELDAIQEEMLQAMPDMGRHPINGMH